MPKTPSMLNVAGVIRGFANTVPVTAQPRRKTHYQTIAKDPAVSPALLFCRSLIDLAIKDAVTGFRNGEPSELSQDAMAWITRRDTKAASFHWCCSWLNLDPDNYRRRTLEQIWQARLECYANPSALRSRYFPKGYSAKQSHSVRRPLLNSL